MKAETTIPVKAETTIPVKAETTIPVNVETAIPVNDETSIPVNAETTIPVNAETTLPTHTETIATTIPVNAETTIPTHTETTATTTPTNAETTIPAHDETTPAKTTPTNAETTFPTHNETTTPTNAETTSTKTTEEETNKDNGSESVETLPITIINSNYIEFYSEGNITKGTTNITKDELENELDNILKYIEIGKKYEINGNGYNLTITPINELSNFKLTFVDFKNCEDKLRYEYNMSSDEILTFLQIEIDKMNEKALTNQVEYAVYDEQMKQLNLSYCKNIEVKITYEITDDSLLNKSMISYFDNLGIDIFNKNDSFFNDLCYPFSISDSDIILEDRLSDIYQNYSFCDIGCEYDEMDLNNMSVICRCKVKTEINTEVDNIYFGEMIQQTFKASNIGVLRCYNLVFNFKNKIKNLGFIIFLILVIIHIICFIIYFTRGINPIIIFVHKEMEKNNYATKLRNPKKKNKLKIQSKKDEDLNNSGGEYNSSFLINRNLKEKKLTGRKSKNVGDLLKKKIKLKNKSNSTQKKLKNIQNSQPIFIFNYKYNNKFYKYSGNGINSSKNNINDNQKKNIYNINKKSNKIISPKKNTSKLNKEKSFPGYYNLIQINANNSVKNKPPQSKFILNNYNYKEAIKYDTRDFWRIFFIILLAKENILNTFFFKTPLELFPVRLSLFIFTYSCDFALNALFYLNQKISDKYHYDGDSLYLYIFVNNMIITIFSALSSYALVKILKQLTNSTSEIENLFRKEENKMRKNKKYKVNLNSRKQILNNLLKIFKTMKIKIICYIIIEFLILLFFLYYITAFCEVYKSTQKSWLYDSFISFLISFPIELLISFFITLIYLAAIRIRIKCLYSFVLFLYRLG